MKSLVLLLIFSFALPFTFAHAGGKPKTRFEIIVPFRIIAEGQKTFFRELKFQILSPTKDLYCPDALKGQKSTISYTNVKDLYLMDKLGNKYNVSPDLSRNTNIFEDFFFDCIPSKNGKKYNRSIRVRHVNSEGPYGSPKFTLVDFYMFVQMDNLDFAQAVKSQFPEVDVKFEDPGKMISVVRQYDQQKQYDYKSRRLKIFDFCVGENGGGDSVYYNGKPGIIVTMACEVPE